MNQSEQIQRLRIRAGQGLGDAVYLQCVVRHLLETNKNNHYEICNAWPDVFLPLMKTGRANVIPFTRSNPQIIAHYVSRKHIQSTDQYQDACLSAGIRGHAEAKWDWIITDPGLINDIEQEAKGRKVLFLQLARPPMDRADGFGNELLPDFSVMDAILDHIKDRIFIVQCGAGKSLHEYFCHMDLSNKTTVKQLIDVGFISDYFLGPCSFIIPMADAWKREHIVVWGNKVKTTKNEFIKCMSPHKVQHRLEKFGGTAHYIWDDWAIAQILKKVDEVFL